MFGLTVSCPSSEWQSVLEAKMPPTKSKETGGWLRLTESREVFSSRPVGLVTLRGPLLPGPEWQMPSRRRDGCVTSSSFREVKAVERTPEYSDTNSTQKSLGKSRNNSWKSGG